MKTEQRARALRAEGISFARIAELLDCSVWHATRCTNDIVRDLKETAGTVVKRGAHNGGCSTLSGMMKISMPRIKALHGAMPVSGNEAMA